MLATEREFLALEMVKAARAADLAPSVTFPKWYVNPLTNRLHLHASANPMGAWLGTAAGLGTLGLAGYGGYKLLTKNRDKNPKTRE